MINLKRIIKFAKDNPTYFFAQLLRRPLHKLNVYLPFTYSFSLKKLWLVLTYRCNLRCKMCAQWGERGRSKYFPQEKLNKELSLEELKSIIDEVKKYNPTIMLMGGEPLLYKDIDKLAEYIKKQNLRCELTTNGLLIDKFSESIIKNFDNVNISLDGPSKINDEIRALSGCYEKVMNNIKKLNKKNNKLYLNICCTISPDNFEHLYELIEEIENNEIKINLLLFQHLEFLNEEILIENKKIWKENFNTDTNYWDSNLIEINNDKINNLISQIKKIKNYKPKNIEFIQFEPNFNWKEIQNFYNYQNLKIFHNKCYAPYLEAFIYPDGNVWTCPGLIMGNVKEDKFKKIWNNKNYRKLRDYLNTHKFFPVCFRCANHWHNIST